MKNNINNIDHKYNILNATWAQNNRVKAFTTLKTCKIESLLLPKNQFWINQQHGINILNAEELLKSNNKIFNADGSYTTKKNIACIIKTADCLPILIMHKYKDFVAAIHAGWKGLANGIIDHFFKEINYLNLHMQDLLFWLGPAIGPSAFEVGEEVFEKFVQTKFVEGKNNFYKKDPDYSKAFKKIDANPHVITNVNKYLANIYQLAKINLNYFGIQSNQIFTENCCTYSRDDLFYSYRKMPNNSDRMYSIIWIE